MEDRLGQTVVKGRVGAARLIAGAAAQQAYARVAIGLVFGRTCIRGSG